VGQAVAEEKRGLWIEAPALDGFPDDSFAVVGGEGTHLAKYTSPGMGCLEQPLLLGPTELKAHGETAAGETDLGLPRRSLKKMDESVPVGTPLTLIAVPRMMRGIAHQGQVETVRLSNLGVCEI
jgi:hypothetical protein